MSAPISIGVIAQIDVHDMAEFERYLARFYAIFERHGGKLVGRSLDAEVMAGEWAMPRPVIMRFPTPGDARRWHSDPDCRALAVHCNRASRANTVMVDGFD